MKNLFLTLILSALTTTVAMADTKAFRDIIGDAANIQLDAESLRDTLKSSSFDEATVRSQVEALAKHVEALRIDVETLDANLQNLTEAQRKDWELAKTKMQLLTVFSDAKKAHLESGDLKKNRTMLRAHAEGLAHRAALLQRTVNKLDR